MISKFPYIFNASCAIRACLSHRNGNLTQFIYTVLMLCTYRRVKTFLPPLGKSLLSNKRLGDTLLNSKHIIHGGVSDLLE